MANSPYRPKLCFLDDNFFGCADWQRILDEVIATGRPFQFKQGLDERLLTDEKCAALFAGKYDGDYIFAFDNLDDAKVIERKIQLARKYSNAVFKFYCFTGYDCSAPMGCWVLESGHLRPASAHRNPDAQPLSSICNALRAL